MKQKGKKEPDAFINHSNHTFNEEQIKLLRCGPTFVPPQPKSDVKECMYIVKASINSLERQMQFVPSVMQVNNNIIDSNDTNINDNNNDDFQVWKYKNPTRREYLYPPKLNSETMEKIQSFENELCNSVNQEVNKYKGDGNFSRIIKDIKQIDNVVVVPSDKTHRLIAH